MRNKNVKTYLERKNFVYYYGLNDLAVKHTVP